MNFREFIDKMDKEGKLLQVKREVSKEQEIADIMKKFDGKRVIFPIETFIEHWREMYSQNKRIKNTIEF